MQSSPEHPGIIELSTFLISDDADDAMTCQHYNSRLAENGLLVAACLMMLLTVAYVCSDLYIIKKRKRANTRIAIRQENLFGPAGLSGMQSCCFCQGVVIFAVKMVGRLQFIDILFLFPNMIVVGLDLQHQAKMGEVNATQDTSGVNSSSSLSCNDSCMTSTTKARKNSASEGSLLMLT